jgi:hypothetical protein
MFMSVPQIQRRWQAIRAVAAEAGGPGGQRPVDPESAPAGEGRYGGRRNGRDRRSSGTDMIILIIIIITIIITRKKRRRVRTGLG